MALFLQPVGEEDADDDGADYKKAERVPPMGGAAKDITYECRCNEDSQEL